MKIKDERLSSVKLHWLSHSRAANCAPFGVLLSYKEIHRKGSDKKKPNGC